MVLVPAEALARAEALGDRRLVLDHRREQLVGARDERRALVDRQRDRLLGRQAEGAVRCVVLEIVARGLLAEPLADVALPGARALGELGRRDGLGVRHRLVEPELVADQHHRRRRACAQLTDESLHEGLELGLVEGGCGGHGSSLAVGDDAHAAARASPHRQRDVKPWPHRLHRGTRWRRHDPVASTAPMSRRAVWQPDAASRGWPRRSSSPIPNAPGVAASISGEPAAGVNPSPRIRRSAWSTEPAVSVPDACCTTSEAGKTSTVVEAQIRDARSGASERLRAEPRHDAVAHAHRHVIARVRRVCVDRLTAAAEKRVALQVDGRRCGCRHGDVAATGVDQRVADGERARGGGHRSRDPHTADRRGRVASGHPQSGEHRGRPGTVDLDVSTRDRLRPHARADDDAVVPRVCARRVERRLDSDWNSHPGPRPTQKSFAAAGPAVRAATTAAAAKAPRRMLRPPSPWRRGSHGCRRHRRPSHGPRSGRGAGRA